MKVGDIAPKAIGRLTYLVGLLEVSSNVLHRFKTPVHHVNHYLPVIVSSTAFATSVFTGIITILLGRGLIRRKRRAWVLALIVLSVNIASEVLHNHFQVVQILTGSSLLVILIIFRSQFYAVSDPATRFQPLVSFIIIIGAIVSVGVFTIYFRHGAEVVGNPSVGDIFLTVIEGLVGIRGPVEFINQRITDTVSFSLGALGIFSLIIPLLLFFRRVKPITRMDSEEQLQVKKLVDHDDDQDSLGYFATRGDKSVIWTNNRKAGIAYRVEAGVMLASGDPFGEFSLWPEAIENFLNVAKLHAWTPAVMGASSRGGEVWVEVAGMLAIDIGDEAIINVKDFTIEGRAMGNVRHMINQTTRKGYSAYTSKWSDLDSSIRSELRTLAKTWRYGTPERGFSMSMDRFGEDSDPDTYVTIAMNEGRIVGLLYFVPWSGKRLSLDRMQRERGSHAGVNELMIVRTAQFAQENGISHISLNFAAFRSLFERAEKISAGPVTRGMRNLIRLFSNWFQVESLYRFNAKFQPEWQTRFVLYPRASDLIRVARAALKAERFISSFRSKSV